MRTLLLGLLLCSHVLHGQTTGALSGRVVDASSAPVAEAQVQAMRPDTHYTATTATDGSFRFAALPTGLYRLRVDHPAHGPVELDEVWVRSGKEEHVPVALLVKAVELRSAEVRTTHVERLEAVSTVPLSVEKSLRYPATFFDPARLAMSYAGVASLNDQANHFSVRGNGPANNAWLLEEVEIVTPNHLTNAGTANDLPALTGGGTTILSAQMLGPSALYTGGLSVPYGNALGGVMDLRLRRGIDQRRAYTVQAGLLGIDLSAEGPFRNGGKATYLVNYRYSTVGLLSAMGVPLGDEAIAFQDLAVTLNLPMGPRSELLLFAMAGNSSNRFEAKDSTEREFDKDRWDIDYEALVAIAGLSFQQRFGGGLLWKTTVAWSQNDQERRASSGPYLQIPALSGSLRLTETKLSGHTRLVVPLGARAHVQVGMHAMERTVENGSIDETHSAWMIRPYLRLRQELSAKVDLDLGVGYSLWTSGGEGVPEPRLALGWQTGDRGKLRFAAGIRSQQPVVQSYAQRRFIPNTFFGPVTVDNTWLGLMRAYDLEIGHSHAFRPHLTLTGTLFGQLQTDIPAETTYFLSSQWWSTSMADVWNETTHLVLAQTGEARRYGLQLALEHHFHRGLYYQMNATLMRASTTSPGFAGDGVASRWDRLYLANAVLGREFEKQKEKLKRTWGVNARVSLAGGAPFGPLPFNVPLSEARSTAFGRLDLRVYLRRERERHSSLWALDLLNATNAQNMAYVYYDSQQRGPVTVYQMGLLPNLSYRIEF